MSTNKETKQFNTCIVINSTVFLLIAYYFVVFSVNIFSIVLAKSVGFDIELFYNGFLHSGKTWTNDSIVLVYFLGNAISLVLAFVFERLYKRTRKYAKGRKIFYLWVYIISLFWFMGNIIVGSLFNFGIGSAFMALGLPRLIRLLLAGFAVFSLMYFGYNAQKHVRVSSNLYFVKLATRDIKNYFIHQMLLPIIIGFVIIVLFKLPDIGFYKFMDIYILLTVVFFIAGLFFRYRTRSITFKTRSADKTKLAQKSCHISYVPMAILFLVLILMRVGLMNGVNI